MSVNGLTNYIMLTLSVGAAHVEKQIDLRVLEIAWKRRWTANTEVRR